jgi:hypothetical protein
MNKYRIKKELNNNNIRIQHYIKMVNYYSVKLQLAKKKNLIFDIEHYGAILLNYKNKIKNIECELNRIKNN